MNYNNKRFKVIQNSSTGEVSSGLIFHYSQQDNVISCSYSGDSIVQGQLLGIVDQSGSINMRYHQVNQLGEIMTGICESEPEVMEDGRIRLYENWQWTCGDHSKGTSILEEV